jgi:hypothetical protein
MILITTIATVYSKTGSHSKPEIRNSAFSRPYLLFPMINVDYHQRWLETVATAVTQQVVRNSG